MFCFEKNRFNPVVHFSPDSPEQRSCGKIIPLHFINYYRDIHIAVFPLSSPRIRTEQHHFIKGHIL